MTKLQWILPVGLLAVSASLMLYAAKTDGMTILTGKQAFSNTASLKPGVARKITAKDLPKPGDTPSGNTPGGRGAVRPPDAMPQAPAGFKVGIYVGEGLSTPRQMRRAPNGDIFVADTSGGAAGAVKVFRGMTADGKPQQTSAFANLPNAFGINFYPPGPNPQWVYVSNTTTLVRFPYKNGDLKATGPAETLISNLPAGGHSTRDIVFSKVGTSLLVAVGSGSSTDDKDEEHHRANILTYKPEGKFTGM